MDASELSSALEGLELRLDEPAREPYSRDRSPFRRLPAAVCVPRNAGEVAAAVAAAAELGVAVTARAGGSSVAGQCLGPGLVIDVSGLGGVEQAGEDSVWCGAGEVLDDVNAALAPSGRRLGPDTVSSGVARIGGLVATNACGARSLVYGRFGEALLEAEVVLADGTVARLSPEEEPEPLRERLAEVRRGLGGRLEDWPRQPRDPGGYRLPEFVERGGALSLVPGSEGTLCLLTRARLRTVPLPTERALTLVAFGGLREALDAAPAMAATGASAVELLDWRLVEAVRGAGLVLPEDTEALLMVEHQGELAGWGAESVRHEAAGALLVERVSVQDADRAWELRNRSLELVAGPAWAPLAMFEDPAVSPERLGGFCDELLELLRGFGLEALVYGHAGAGCLHVRPLCNPADPKLGARLLEAAEAVCDLAREHGGALTGEHGWGLARSHLVERALGPGLYAACRAVKAAFDPKDVLNPGIIVGGRDPLALFDPASPELLI